MHWKTPNPLGCFTVSEAIEIHDDVACVFTYWNRYEDFPRFMESVRRTKCIDEQRVLWDIDVAGHQVVWEARILESIPEKRIRWKSSWGAANSGEVRFEPLPEGRTRLSVEIEYRPRGFFENLGAHLGLADLHVRRDLERFQRFVESRPPNVLDEWRSSRPSLQPKRLDGAR